MATQLHAFRRGGNVSGESLIRGQRGAWFGLNAEQLDSGQRWEWSIVADVDQDAAAVAELVKLLKSGENLRALSMRTSSEARATW